MTTYRAGQRVRIEWPDENGCPAQEGVLIDRGELVVDMPNEWLHLDDLPRTCTVIVLSEPRPEEPTGRGAVVEATTDPHDLRPRQWIHMGFGDWLTVMDDAREPGGFWTRRERWSDLLNPVVLHEGWSE